MEIFISWSGNNSRQTAEAVDTLLFEVFGKKTQAWFSQSAIQKGSMWGIELAAALERCVFGIICVTRINRNSPWLLFESGALAKAVNHSRVCPLLVDMIPAEIDGPLSQFQITQATRHDIFLLINAINKLLDRPLKPAQVHAKFQPAWKKFSNRLRQNKAKKDPEVRPEIHEELVRFLRRLNTYEDFTVLLKPIKKNARKR